MNSALEHNYASVTNWLSFSNLTVKGNVINADFTSADTTKIVGIYNSKKNEINDGKIGEKDAIEYAIDSYVMNTFARYLGALEYKNKGTITKIVFKDKEYTWKADSLGNFASGSNWRDSDLNSLVAEVVNNSENRGIRNVEIEIFDGEHSINVIFNAIEIPNKEKISFLINN